jgi:hypothetical protein
MKTSEKFKKFVGAREVNNVDDVVHAPNKRYFTL